MGRKLPAGLPQDWEVGSGFAKEGVRKRTRRTLVTVKAWTPWRRTPERGGDPRLCRPGYAPASCGPRAKRFLLSSPPPPPGN